VKPLSTPLDGSGLPIISSKEGFAFSGGGGGSLTEILTSEFALRVGGFGTRHMNLVDVLASAAGAERAWAPFFSLFRRMNHTRQITRRQARTPAVHPKAIQKPVDGPFLSPLCAISAVFERNVEDSSHSHPVGHDGRHCAYHWC